MKKYLYAAMAFLSLMCVGLTACGSDGDDNDGPDNSGNNDSKIVGAYEIVKTTTNITRPFQKRRSTITVRKSRMATDLIGNLHLPRLLCMMSAILPTQNP